MVKLWNKLTAGQVYLLSGIAFLWIAGALCGTRAALAFAGFLTAIILIIGGGMLCDADMKGKKR